MARQENTQLRGRIGNVDFYGRNGDFFAKPAALHCRQTVATKEQAGVFGKASRLASLLWEYLKPWSKDCANDNAWSRLNRAVANSVRAGALAGTTPLDSMPYISGFQFNTTTAINERLRFTMPLTRTDQGTLELNIPAINPRLHIAAISGTKIVYLKIFALSCTTNNTTTSQHFTTTVQIPYTNTILPAQQIALPVTTSPAAITLVAIAVAYHTTDNLQLPAVNKPVWMPAGIIDALYN